MPLRRFPLASRIALPTPILVASQVTVGKQLRVAVVVSGGKNRVVSPFIMSARPAQPACVIIHVLDVAITAAAHTVAVVAVVLLLLAAVAVVVAEVAAEKAPAAAVVRPVSQHPSPLQPEKHFQKT